MIRIISKLKYTVLLVYHRGSVIELKVEYGRRGMGCLRSLPRPEHDPAECNVMLCFDRAYLLL